MFILQENTIRKEKVEAFIVSKCTHYSKQLFLLKKTLYFTSLHKQTVKNP